MEESQTFCAHASLSQSLQREVDVMQSWALMYSDHIPNEFAIEARIKKHMHEYSVRVETVSKMSRMQN